MFVLFYLFTQLKVSVYEEINFLQDALNAVKVLPY